MVFRLNLQYSQVQIDIYHHKMPIKCFPFFSFLFLGVLTVTRIRWMETDGKGISKLDLPRELFFLLRKEILRRKHTLSSSVPPKVTASESLRLYICASGVWVTARPRARVTQGARERHEAWQGQSGQNQEDTKCQ